MKRKLLVLSDSHGNLLRLEKIVRNESPFDFIIHCGDGIRDLLHIDIPMDSKIIRVAGNIDRAHGIDLDDVCFESIEGHKFMITHGDLLRVHSDTSNLYREARTSGVDVVLFGHTHRAYMSNGNPFLFNPGSASNGQYGIIIVDSTVDFHHLSCAD
jgi:putative phosphoesterase